jgi:hypothetical protein
MTEGSRALPYNEFPRLSSVAEIKTVEGPYLP